MATRRLQRNWRQSFCHLTTAKLVDRFVTEGPTIDHVKSISFETLVVFLREKSVIALTKAALQRIHLLSTFRHGSPNKALAPENVNVKVFLAGFMIAYRPTHVFESMGALEHALLDAATPLLTAFQKICNCIRSSAGHSFQDVPNELTKDFPTLLFEYLKRFKAWKVPDEAKLTCRIKHALIALYQAQEHLPPDEPVDSKLSVEFRTQIDRLRSKLQQIAGADVLNQFDEQRLAGHVPGEPGGAGGSGGGSGGMGGGAYAALPGRMTNEQLAHELLLDAKFQLDESGGCSVENPVFHRIRESFHQAFWDSLVDDLRLATPCYVRVLRVLSEISDGIKDLSGSREEDSISEIVDLDHIKVQAEQGLYGWDSCLGLISNIVTVVQRVQAPKRDEETKAKWKQTEQRMRDASDEEHPRAFCKALEFLLDRVNAMRIDAANARLRLIAPVIKDHGIDYERGKFMDKLKDGSLTLERVHARIKQTVYHEVKHNNVDLDCLLEGKAVAFVHVHTAMMVGLVCDQTTLKADTCPETLLFDVHRIATLQTEFQSLATVITIHITAQHGLLATKSPVDKQVAEKVAECLVAQPVCIDLEPLMGTLGQILGASTLSAEQRQTLVRSLMQCSSPTDAVHALIAQRLRNVVSGYMQSGSFTSQAKIVGNFRAFAPQIEKLATRIVSISNLNRVVHLSAYNKLIGEEALGCKAGLAETEPAAAASPVGERRPREPEPVVVVAPPAPAVVVAAAGPTREQEIAAAVAEAMARIQAANAKPPAGGASSSSKRPRK